MNILIDVVLIFNLPTTATEDDEDVPLDDDVDALEPE